MILFFFFFFIDRGRSSAMLQRDLENKGPLFIYF